VKVKKQLKVMNPMGLHTRPATEIVKLLQKFRSKVTIKYKHDVVNARSILGILMLAAHQNARVEVVVEGVDAEETMSRLEEAFAKNFGE
jgi:phosphocarrier protein HPr